MRVRNLVHVLASMPWFGAAFTTLFVPGVDRAIGIASVTLSVSAFALEIIHHNRLLMKMGKGSLVAGELLGGFVAVIAISALFWSIQAETPLIDFFVASAALLLKAGVVFYSSKSFRLAGDPSGEAVVEELVTIFILFFVFLMSLNSRFRPGFEGTLILGVSLANYSRTALRCIFFKKVD